MKAYTRVCRAASVLAALVTISALAVPVAADARQLPGGPGRSGGNSRGSASATPWAGRTPGAPVAQLSEINRATSGGTNPKVGTVPSTNRLGIPNPGVVPVVGNASAHAADGAYVAYESQVTSRIVDLMVVSPALGGAAPVRLILPANWSSQSSWPVLWLLHGANDLTDYQSWTWDTDVASYLSNAKAIIALPSIGQNAYATNWWNYGSGNTLQYDTFVATELPQILQAGYRAGTVQAVAGASTGGYSAIALAALHPGQYRAAASYSGLPDTQVGVISAAIEFGALSYFQSPFAMWGDWLFNSNIWTARNPATHLANLGGVKLFVSAGNGSPGPLSPPGASKDGYEPLTLTSSQSFVAKARGAGLAVTSDFYGNGTHSWPYWQREFHLSWPMIASALGIPA